MSQALKRIILPARLKAHEEIDGRSFAMVKAIVEKIDRDPERKGFAKARATSHRWMQQRPSPANKEWMEILKRPLEEVRLVLLDASENGKRLRQNDPFCGILTPQERWEIYREFGQKTPPSAASDMGSARE